MKREVKAVVKDAKKIRDDMQKFLEKMGSAGEDEKKQAKVIGALREKIDSDDFPDTASDLDDELIQDMRAATDALRPESESA